ncbi:twin-arginine translocase TatA/TatE family subunit [Aquabacterium sp.]|uniref:twin-arginine translocase TatA/TatE family subunit n=1 Tax=Aquabacterium sp. TaxID=1872578 RepID=UPI002D885EC7|nr:twin-arginine translocase TatA/TatE family subunit [Aquabacterium sp.]HET8870204.1 twin-arginine translocase TatA/TatE family subunit [Aquabacterium sp.]HEX5310588.1 twin-arginine translocase TatA/TatE family subunit [Aquabacterium sp.]
MIDFGIDKLAIIGAVALIVIGPEKLPRVARTIGVLVGKAQRYVSQVQTEVNRSMELDELKKMKQGIEEAAHNINTEVSAGLQEATRDLYTEDSEMAHRYGSFGDADTPYYGNATPVRKNWRLKRGATPLWYKQKSGVRRHAQSGAARVARFRPQPPHSTRN